MSGLAAAVDRGIQAAGLPGEERTFRAHLTLARGKETEQENASLSNIIKRNLAVWQQQAEAKRLTFTFRDETASNGEHAKLFPVPMLRTVINNLVRNAIYHTVEGGITLVAKPAGFTVCDTGPGIGNADKGSIFKPFYRGESGSQQGLGLGLSLVQRICQKEQWSVSVSDNQPSGCCFTVSFKK